VGTGYERFSSSFVHFLSFATVIQSVVTKGDVQYDDSLILHFFSFEGGSLARRASISTAQQLLAVQVSIIDS